MGGFGSVLLILLLMALPGILCLAQSENAAGKKEEPPPAKMEPKPEPAQDNTTKQEKPAGATEEEPKPNKPKEEKDPPPKALTVAKVLDNMEAARVKLKGFRAKVTKHRNTVPLEVIEVYEGNIIFKMPRLLRLELKSKATGRTTIDIVGKKYAVTYRPEDKQAEGVMLKDLKKEKRGDNPLEYGLAGKVHELKKTYNIKLLPSEKMKKAAVAVLELTPKGAGKNSKNSENNENSKVTLWLSQKSWLPLRIREVKNDGDIIETLTLHGMKIDAKIKDKVFKLDPDIDVIIHPTE